MLRLNRAQRSQVRRATTRLLTLESRTFVSESDPSRTYRTIILQDGRVECSCRGWTFKRAKGLGRWCKHAAELVGVRDRTCEDGYWYVTQIRFAAITREATGL